MRLAVVLLLACASCVSIGEQFDLKAASRLRQGMTLAQVEEELGGSPTTRAMLADGRESCVWMHSNAFGTTKTLVVVFDSKGHLIRKQQ